MKTFDGEPARLYHPPRTRYNGGQRAAARRDGTWR